MVLEILYELLHGSHICKKDTFDNSLFYCLHFLSCEFATQKVIVRDVEQFDSLGCVEVFLNVLFSIHLADG